MEWIGTLLLFAMSILVVLDVLLLITIGKKPIFKRNFNERLNLGDENPIKISIENKSGFQLFFELNDWPHLKWRFRLHKPLHLK